MMFLVTAILLFIALTATPVTGVNHGTEMTDIAATAANGAANGNVDRVVDRSWLDYVENNHHNHDFFGTTTTIMDRMFDTTFMVMETMEDSVKYMSTKMSEVRTTVCTDMITPHLLPESNDVVNNNGDDESFLVKIVYDKLHLCARPPPKLTMWEKIQAFLAANALTIIGVVLMAATVTGLLVVRQRQQQKKQQREEEEKAATESAAASATAAAIIIQRAVRDRASRRNDAAITIQRLARRWNNRRSQAATTIQCMVRVWAAKRKVSLLKNKPAATIIANVCSKFIHRMKTLSKTDKDDVYFKYFVAVKAAAANKLRETVQMETMEEDDGNNDDDNNTINYDITEEMFERACRILGLHCVICEHDLLQPEETSIAVVKGHYRVLIRHPTVRSDPSKQRAINEAKDLVMECCTTSEYKKTTYEEMWTYNRTHTMDPTVAFDNQSKPDWLARHLLGVAQRDVYNYQTISHAMATEMATIDVLRRSKLCDQTSDVYDGYAEVYITNSIHFIQQAKQQLYPGA